MALVTAIRARSRYRSVSRHLRRLGAVAAIIALAGGCGSGGDEPPATDAGAPQRLSPATFEGQATTVDGQPFDLAALAGQNLVIWFWAPW